MINNERTYMRKCKECGCTPKNDEWAVNSNEHCFDCEQEFNDYYNACNEEEQERANHIAKSISRGEL